MWTKHLGETRVNDHWDLIISLRLVSPSTEELLQTLVRIIQTSCLLQGFLRCLCLCLFLLPFLPFLIGLPVIDGRVIQHNCMVFHRIVERSRNEDDLRTDTERRVRRDRPYDLAALVPHSRNRVTTSAK